MIFLKDSGQSAIYGDEKDAVSVGSSLFPAGTQLNEENQSTRNEYCKGDKQYQHNNVGVIRLLTAAKVRNFYIFCQRFDEILFLIK